MAILLGLIVFALAVYSIFATLRIYSMRGAEREATAHSTLNEAYKALNRWEGVAAIKKFEEAQELGARFEHIAYGLGTLYALANLNPKWGESLLSEAKAEDIDGFSAPVINRSLEIIVLAGYDFDLRIQWPVVEPLAMALLDPGEHVDDRVEQLTAVPSVRWASQQGNMFAALLMEDPLLLYDQDPEYYRRGVSSLVTFLSLAEGLEHLGDIRKQTSIVAKETGDYSVLKNVAWNEWLVSAYAGGLQDEGTHRELLYAFEQHGVAPEDLLAYGRERVQATKSSPNRYYLDLLEQYVQENYR